MSTDRIPTGNDPASADPVVKGFDAFLCRAWGETDLPSAELVADWEGVRRFMVREWLGEEEATDYDGTMTLDRLKADFDEHEEDHRGSEFNVEFEIGGVSIERVCGFATPQPAEKFAMPELNDDLIEILGRPNFACIRIAEVLRHSGTEIKQKAEHEQATVLHYMLGLYLQHGTDWWTKVREDLEVRCAAAKGRQAS